MSEYECGHLSLFNPITLYNLKSFLFTVKNDIEIWFATTFGFQHAARPWSCLESVCLVQETEDTLLRARYPRPSLFAL